MKTINKLQSFSQKTYYFSSNDKNSLLDFTRKFQALFFSNYTPSQEIAIICIGTDRVTGDSLGPFVGHFLEQKDLPEKISIWGNLSKPVHALNLIETMEEIHKKCVNPFCIVIDACLGCPKHIGQVTLCCAPLKPGEGVLKKLPHVGDMSITGIVNRSSKQSFYLLQNTRLHLVVQLASFIANGLARTFTL